MKPALLLFILLTVLAGPVAAGPQYLDLPAAAAAQKVTVSARAQGLGPESLHCTIRNQTGQPLPLRVPPGLRFESADPGAQDIFTFQQQLLVLAPGASQQVRLWAFCMEKSDYSPAANSEYTFRGPAGQGLQPLGDSLQKYPGLAAYYGQMFVWALSNHEPVREVRVEPRLLRAANNVLRYIASVTGQVGKARASNDNRPSVKTFSKRAALLYHSPTAQVGTLHVYGPDGQLLHELLKNRPIPPGVMQYTIGLNDIVDIDATPVYTIRLLDPRGQVLKEVKVDAATPEQVAEPAKIVFNFPFEVKNLLRNARVRVRLADGTLVEEILERKYLPPGNFRMQLFFNHLYPPGTAFVAQLETADGKVLTTQPVVPEPAQPEEKAPAARPRRR